MPLNESRGYTRSNLTKQQKAEALAAIYGIRPEDFSTMPTPTDTQNFSAADIQRMREMVAAHDSKNKGGIREFDLNNPPQVPYTHQEFPRVVYHGKHGHKSVHSKEQLVSALADGWQKDPIPAAEPEAPLDEESQKEIAAVEAKLRAKAAANKNTKAAK